MKKKQITALLLSAVLAFSACMPAGVKAYAAEDAAVSAETDAESEAAVSETAADDQEAEQDAAIDDASAEENSASDAISEDAAPTETDTDDHSDDATNEEDADAAATDDQQASFADTETPAETAEEDEPETPADTAAEGDTEAPADTAANEETVGTTIAAPEEVVAEEVVEKEETDDEAAMGADVTNDALKAMNISVNKEYTQAFEKVGDRDCFKFKTGGGNIKVQIWYIPGDMSNPDNYSWDERMEFRYSTYGKWSAAAGMAPTYMWGASAIMTSSILTPFGYEQEGQDYTVSGKYIVKTVDLDTYKAGTEIGIQFTGAYKGSYKFKVIGKAYVVKKSIKKATVTVANGVYSGSAVKPKVTVKLGTKTLTRGTDYTVTYSNNIRIGSKAVAKITGKGNYKDTVSKTFTIKRRSITNSVDLKLSNTTFTYSGKAKKPTFSIYLPAVNNVGGISLVKNTDYTFKYENNVEPGTGKLIVTGKGNYTGTAVRTFKIEKKVQPATLKQAKVTTTYAKIGTKYRPAIQNRAESAKITYTSSNTKVATVKDGVVTVKGTGSAVIKITLAATKHYKGKVLNYTVNVLKKQTITTGIADGAKVAYSTKPIPLKAVVKTGNGKLTYTSSDTTIADVDGKGNLILKNAKKLGTATITITAATTSTYVKAVKTLKITTVKGKPVLSCEKMVQDHNYKDAPFALGVSTTEPVVLTYQSDKPDIASVSDDGTVTLNTENINKNTSVNITVKSKGTSFFKASDDLVVTLNIIVVSINDDIVYNKQEWGSSNCTFYALAHMMRRKAILDGRTDWDVISQKAIEDPDSALAQAVWIEGTGLKGTFSYSLAEDYSLNGKCVASGSLSVESLASLLKDHPEGIEVYDTGLPHAVLVTGYDSSTGTFYCYDSDPGQPKGFIPLSESLIGDKHGNSQDNVLANIGKYWYLQ